MALRSDTFIVEFLVLLVPLGDCLAGENPSIDPIPAFRSCVFPIELNGISIPGSAHFKGFHTKGQGALLPDWLSMWRGMNESQSGDFS